MVNSFLCMGSNVNQHQFIFIPRTCVEQIIDLSHSFWHLAVPVCATSSVWGDNKSQVTNSKFLYLRINKRHNILSYHFVDNMVAKVIHVAHIPSKYNLVNILSNNWCHQPLYKNLISLYFIFMVMEMTSLLIQLSSLNLLSMVLQMFHLSNNLTLHCSQRGTLFYWKDMQWGVIKIAQSNQSS